MYNLTGKVAIVTGVSGRRGFGRAIAGALARDGADVAIVDKFALPQREEDLADGWQGLNSVSDEIKSIGRRSLPLVCDISHSDEVSRLMEQVLAEFGRIDLLVNNAGVHLFGGIESITDEIWNKNISVNLTGTFYCSRAAARIMIKQNNGGNIINIASVQGKEGTGNGDGAYCASKFGVVGLTQSLALELAPHGIRVNAVCPGRADTDITNDHYRSLAQSGGISVQEVRKKLIASRISSIPLGRLATTEDVSNLVAFLASEESDFITGQAINVCGGLLVAH